MKEKNNEIPVYIVGGNHHNTLGVIRSFGEKNIYPYVIIQCADKEPYIRVSKYVKKYWIFDNDEDILNLLRNEGKKNKGEKSVLIACADNLSSLVDSNYDELCQWFYLPGSEIQGRITYLMDKEVMSNFAKEIGFRIPLSVAVNTNCRNEIDIPFPWIIKPLVSKDGVKADIERIYSKEGWESYCERHHAAVQVQKLIDKDYEYQLIGLSLRGGEEVIIPGLSFIIRPAATTNTGFLHYIPLDDSYHDVLEIGKKFLKATGYSGLFSLEFLRGKDGKDYFMEINFRNDGNAICVTAAGVNLPYIWYVYHTGGDYCKDENNYKIKSVYVMPEFADLSLIAHGKLNFFEWLKDIHRTDRFMEYDKNDIKPFFRLCEKTLKSGMSKLVKFKI